MKKYLSLFLLGAVAFAQKSPFTNAPLQPVVTFTASGQTSASINLSADGSTTGNSFSAGAITLIGTSLTTVTFAVQCTVDGTNYFALNFGPNTAAASTWTTTNTATANGLYYVNLAGCSKVRFVTSGTFTGTSITLQLTGSPNALVARRKGSGLPCNPVTAWPMTEGTGLTLNDTSGNANTATIGGASNVTWQTNAGFSGTTPLWTGSGLATAASTTATNFSGAAPFSVIVPMSSTVHQSGAFVSSLDPTNNFIGWEFGTQTNGTSNFPTVFLVNTYPTNAIELPGVSGDISDGNRHVLAFTTDGTKTAAGVIMYIDGAAISSTPVHDTLTASIANSLPLNIANRHDGSFDYKGVTAGVQIYPCLLSPSQIATFH